jgi:hypothetical protein
LWDHDERRKASAWFNQMIDGMRTSGAICPSNLKHIAAALRLMHDPVLTTKSRIDMRSIAPIRIEGLHCRDTPHATDAFGGWRPRLI